MRTLYLTLGLTLTLGTTNCLLAQNQNSEKVRYVYSSTTQESYNEIELLTVNKPDERQSALKKLQEYQKKGKVILSTKEYAPIKTRIEKAPTNADPADANAYEEMLYAQKVAKRYVVVTELLK